MELLLRRTGHGRLMSRRAAFSTLSMEQYRKEMKGIYSTCVVPDTLDESPMAYKSMEEIIAQIATHGANRRACQTCL